MTNSETLLDVILTNAPEMFKKCGIYEPEISDHRMIYGELTEKVRRHKTKTITLLSVMRTITLLTVMRSTTTGRHYLSQLWINMHP